MARDLTPMEYTLIGILHFFTFVVQRFFSLFIGLDLVLAAGPALVNIYLPFYSFLGISPPSNLQTVSKLILTDGASNQPPIFFHPECHSFRTWLLVNKTIIIPKDVRRQRLIHIDPSSPLSSSSSSSLARLARTGVNFRAVCVFTFAFCDYHYPLLFGIDRRFCTYCCGYEYNVRTCIYYTCICTLYRDAASQSYSVRVQRTMDL